MGTITKTATKDAVMGKAIGGTFSGWNGTDDHLWVGVTFDGNWKTRAVVYFTIDFTGWTGITSATLTLHEHASGAPLHTTQSAAPSTVTASRMLKDWGEGTNVPEGGYTATLKWEWNNRFDAFTTLDEIQKTNVNMVANGDDNTWDVTEIVRAWFNGSANYGFMIRNSNESSVSKGVEFFSSNNNSYKPQLTIVYSTNVPPTVPTNLTPSNDVVINNLIPSMNGTFNDPDVADRLSAVQILLYEDDGVSVKWNSGTVSALGSTFTVLYGGPALTGNTFYQWKARTRDLAGQWGEGGPDNDGYSALVRFKANSIPAPPTLNLTQTPSTDVRNLSPTFNITHVDPDPSDNKMYGYHAILEKSDGTAVWDSGDISTSGTPVTTKSFAYAGPALAWQTSYRWRARTRDSNLAWGPYSANSTFTTHKTSVPTNLSAQSTIVGAAGGGNDYADFSADRSNTDDGITSYHIILYGPNSTTSVLWDSGILTTGISGGSGIDKRFTGNLSYASTYYWKIRFNEFSGDVGGPSDYTALQSFVTPQDATVPTQTAPVGTQVPGAGTLTPAFQGSRSTNFDRFQIVVYKTDGSQVRDTGELSQASGTSYNWTYTGSPALEWGVTYRWKIRVGAGGGSTASAIYSTLQTFTTEAAGTPTLTSPTTATNYWQSTATPSLQGSRSGTDTIDLVNYRVLNAAGTAVLFDSGWVDVANATTFTITYGTAGTGASPATAPTLAGGTVYQWQAKYTKTGGQVGSWSTLVRFRINGAPSIPQNLYPTPGMVVRDTLRPVFKATYVDPDLVAMGDTPNNTNGWTIEVRNNNTDAVIATKNISDATAGLTGGNIVAGENVYTWQVGDATLAYGIDYKWRTWFTDSKGAVGVPSSYQTFRLGQSPTSAFISPTPSILTSVSTTRPEFVWSFTGASGKTQQKWRLQLRRDDGVTLTEIRGVGAATTYKIDNGIVRDLRTYTAFLWVTDSENLEDASPATTSFVVYLDAPNPIDRLSATVEEERSRIYLEWDPPTDKAGQTFGYYAIYRKNVTEADWYEVGTQKPKSNTMFFDWYAGQGVEYQYRVTQVVTATDGSDLESGDSEIPTAKLESDVWMVIGRDRSYPHIFELFVYSEQHQKPVQQETFEPLGSSHKVISRGSVLGTEGTVNTRWIEQLVYEDTGEVVDPNNVDIQRNTLSEVHLGKRQIAYLTNNSGPHILKNPFGDVYDVEFAGPNFVYSPSGHLEAELAYTEVTDPPIEIIDFRSASEKFN